MVVAEKFQTGFDQPRLYAMYVDKTLTGLAAVQTLSRLNRIDHDKDGTFVLDFVNDAGDIAAAFELCHVETVAPPSDPNLLFDTRRALDEFGVLDRDEATALAGLLLAPKVDHARIHATLGPAVDRFWALDEKEQERFRDALGRFVRTYSFLSQIVSFADTELERDYLFGRALFAFVRPDAGDAVDLGGAVELTHLRHEQTFSGSVALDDDGGEVRTIFSGTGRQVEPPSEPLSAIIARFNLQFGTDWTDADRLVFDATADDLVHDQAVQLTAPSTTHPRTSRSCSRSSSRRHCWAGSTATRRWCSATSTTTRSGPRSSRCTRTFVHARARVAYQEHCPIGELLGPGLKSQHLEYKRTLRVAEAGDVLKALEVASLKTVAAFLNGAEGGTLLIGVADDGTVVGLAADYESLRSKHRPDKDDRDAFQLHFHQIVVNAVGAAAATGVSLQLHTVDSHDVARVHVRPSVFPVDATVIVEVGGQAVKQTRFFVRIGNGTRHIDDPAERQKYVAGRWGHGVAAPE